MKTNVFFTFLSLALASVISFSAWRYAANGFVLFYSIGYGFLFFLVFLLLFALRFNNQRTNINVKTICLGFTFVLVALMIIFGFPFAAINAFIIVNSLAFLVFLGLVYFVVQNGIEKS